MNMLAIGKKISGLRKQRDMTQVELADKLGVTYQAVSSWERGNSMPDISKLPDISQVLGVAIDELLGNAKTAHIVQNMLNSGEVSSDLESLIELAPILKPSQMNSLARQSSGGETELDAEMLSSLAVHMDSEDLKEVILHSGGVDDRVIVEIAHYFCSEDLKDIIMSPQGVSEEVIVQVACYLESDDLKDIIMSSEGVSKEVIATIACYMESEDLKEILMFLK